MRDGVRGFSLIELLIVLVVISILAAIVIPRFTQVRDDALLTAVRSDLRVLANQQAHYQSNNQVYTTVPSDMTDLIPSEGVELFINEVNQGRGWAATAHHEALPGRPCGIYYGNASAANAGPATQANVVMCQD